MQVKWSKGVSAPGSSGSPLIDAETGKVVGVLTGGLSDCHATGSPDYYGRLSAVSPSPPVQASAVCESLQNACHVMIDCRDCCTFLSVMRLTIPTVTECGEGFRMVLEVFKYLTMSVKFYPHVCCCWKPWKPA